ncbi:hypothetical protein, partial [Burkholderia gladioli]|uniref:hypothetical protein n=1 Tax=Burkholderia gladioli TaxID=28095 RepID=UPI001ABB32E2
MPFVIEQHGGRRGTPRRRRQAGNQAVPAALEMQSNRFDAAASRSSGDHQRQPQGGLEPAATTI